MNLNKLFDTQKVLDARIEKEHPRFQDEDRLAKKILALQVELGELANEWRGFKFWSKYQQPRKIISTTQGATSNNAMFYQCSNSDCGERFEKDDNRLTDLFGKNDEDCPICEEGYLLAFRHKNPLLEEYVDCLHFILSIGLEFPINIKGLEKYSVYDTYPNRNETFIFNKLFGIINSILLEDESEALGYYYSSFQWLLELGCKLGFTWEQIEQAYYEKNEVNHERQNTGY